MSFPRTRLTFSQPEDWDEDAPLMITDMNAVKPADWLEDEPEVIPDPDAEKPEEWDVSSCPPTHVVPADPCLG